VDHQPEKKVLELYKNEIKNHLIFLLLFRIKDNRGDVIVLNYLKNDILDAVTEGCAEGVCGIGR